MLLNMIENLRINLDERKRSVFLPWKLKLQFIGQSIENNYWIRNSMESENLIDSWVLFRFKNKKRKERILQNYLLNYSELQICMTRKNRDRNKSHTLKKKKKKKSAKFKISKPKTKKLFFHENVRIPRSRNPIIRLPLFQNESFSKCF